MLAIIAATPLQIFNSLNFVLNKYPLEKVDYYILPFAVRNIEKYCNNLTEIENVNKVYILNKFYSNWGKYGFVYDALFEYKKFFKDKRYDILLTTFVGDRANVIYNRMWRINHDLQVFLYEEGIGIYTRDSFNKVQKSWLHRIYSYCIREKELLSHIDRICVYQPMLLCTNQYNVSIIPSLDKNIVGNRIIQCLNLALGYSDADYMKQRFIYFDQWFYRNENDENYMLFREFSQASILKALFNNNKDVLVRLHPISQEQDYVLQGFALDKQTDDIWESVLLNNTLTDRVFITLFSSAVFSPKIIFDREITIILIGKAVKYELMKTGVEDDIRRADFFWNESIETFTLNIKRLYKNQNKVIIPESFIEAKRILEEYE